MVRGAAKPSSGLEPETPLLPCASGGSLEPVFPGLCSSLDALGRDAAILDEEYSARKKEEDVLAARVRRRWAGGGVGRCLSLSLDRGGQGSAG